MLTALFGGAIMRGIVVPSMLPGSSSGRVYRFGLFEVDPSSGVLTRKGIRIKIQEQPLRVLVLLLERAGDVISRDEMRQRLWPEGTYVDFDGSLNVILKKLRATLEDDSDNPRFIETVPRRGYRFIAPASVSGTQPLGLHSFRHTNSTAMDSSGIRRQIREQRLGYSSSDVTSGYTHTQDERVAAEKLGELFGTGWPEKLRGKPISFPNLSQKQNQPAESNQQAIANQ
jgi:DNA-binding winged helix-turn-helix (wHTH) protein